MKKGSRLSGRLEMDEPNGRCWWIARPIADWNSVPNKSKIPFSFMFEIIFLILSNTDTRRCLVEPWASFMSNVIGSIWRNLKKKKENVLALSADSNTEFQTSKWLCGSWRHFPQPTRVAFPRCCVRCNSWRGKNRKKLLHTLQKQGEIQIHCK